MEAKKEGILWDPAFSYFVAWSPDSRWVSIEGGSHKFWHAEIYHLIDSKFQPVELPPSRSFSRYFHAHEHDLVVQPKGISAAIQKISPRDYDYPQVCWMGNGLLAIEARQYLLNDPDYLNLNQNLYYLIDTERSPATISGFGR